MTTSNDPKTSLKASCHCGAVTIQTPGTPPEINECQCTLCRRYGAAWGYYNPKDIRVSLKDDLPTRKYIWGDRTIEFHFCSICGCITHWKSIEESDEMGINTRLMNPEDIKYVNRKMDFEQLLQPLESGEGVHAEDKARY
jgi:hypothetical protein